MMGGWRAVAGLGMKGTGEEAGRDYKNYSQKGGCRTGKEVRDIGWN